MNYWGIFFILYCVVVLFGVLTFAWISENKANKKKVKRRNIEYIRVVK